MQCGIADYSLFRWHSSQSAKKSYFDWHNYFIITRQITNDLWLINLQHRLSEHPLSLPCSEEWWLFSVQVAQQPKYKKLYFDRHDYFLITSQIAKRSLINFKLAAQAKWTSTFITMLWGIAGYSLFRWHGSQSAKIRILFDMILTR